MLDRLPDGVLLDLIKQAPQLGLVNRRMFGLAELACRNRLLTFYNFCDEQIDGLAADVRELLHLESWLAVEEVAQYDFWFFGPEHIKTFADTVTLSPGKRSWRLLEGAPWGGSLYMLSWSNNYLEYTTKLRAGRYDLYLEFMGKPVDICKMQFHVVQSPQVKQKFASLPPAAWIDRQAVSHGEIDVLSPTRFYVGLMDVAASDVSPWSSVKLRIECADWSVPLEGLVLNYLYFEKHPSPDSASLDWVMRSSGSHLRPSAAWPEIYRRSNARKRRWNCVDRPSHAGGEGLDARAAA